MYRLRVVPCSCRWLVEREGDIEALLLALHRRAETTGRAQDRRHQSAALKVMLDYEWPGNVRELRNVVEHAFAVGTTPVLSLDDLHAELAVAAAHRRRQPAAEERTRIVHALARAGGRKGDAAALLGISRSTLSRKLR